MGTAGAPETGRPGVSTRLLLALALEAAGRVPALLEAMRHAVHDSAGCAKQQNPEGTPCMLQPTLDAFRGASTSYPRSRQAAIRQRRGWECLGGLCSLIFCEFQIERENIMLARLGLSSEAACYPSHHSGPKTTRRASLALHAFIKNTRTRLTSKSTGAASPRCSLPRPPPGAMHAAPSVWQAPKLHNSDRRAAARRPSRGRWLALRAQQ
jgi:hypothetical protein